MDADERANLGRAFRIAQEFAERPHGWLVLSGAYGCGKTHLAAAIGNYNRSRGLAPIFRSVPDALASAAHQLKGKGWVAGETWGYEITIPASADCGLEGPNQARPIAEWAKLGFARANKKPWTDRQLALEAYLMSPGGGYGPSFLVLENFKVLRRYNTSDLYAVFIGNLADRIAGGGDFAAPWSAGPQRTHVIEEIQERLKAAGYGVEKIDGKVGSNTRHLIGTYQRDHKLKVDCWPTDAVLAHMRTTASR
jgi:hypothetical protein